MNAALNSQTEIILEARNITRFYPGNVALKDITYRVYRGCVNVLIGENGAGKSTLMRILSGVERPDLGEILLHGAPVKLRTPGDASRLGIAIVHQELSVMQNMIVSDNIFAGRELTHSLLLDVASQNTRSAHALQQLKQNISERAQAGSLSLGARQLIELARSLAHSASILILDEPTSSLSNAETEALFDVLAELKSAGVTIIYISHRLHELLHLGDHFTVLRSGSIVGEGSRNEVTRQWIVDRMTGGNRSEALAMREKAVSQEVMLAVENLSVSASTSSTETCSALHEISFSLHKGELLGIYGLLGAGRTELLEVLAGARKRESGIVRLNETPLHILSVEDALRVGIALVPEDRQRDGLVQSLTVRENIALAGGGWSLPAKSKEDEQMRGVVEALNIVPKNLELPVSSLSGGNQQKVLIARCLMREPKVLLLDEPTRGVDVGARAEIYRTLQNLAAEGLSILFTSSEVDETRMLADRVLVLRQGRIAAEISGEQITDDALFSAASPQVQNISSTVVGVTA